jgi:hypothetical protein
MPTIIKPKRTETANAIPTSDDLEVGELAINIADRVIYTKNTNNDIVIIGQYVPVQELSDASVDNGITFSIALG